MDEDPIVAEIRQYRDFLTAQHEHDLRQIAASLRKREQSFGRPLENPGPKEQLKQTGR